MVYFSNNVSEGRLNTIRGAPRLHEGGCAYGRPIEAKRSQPAERPERRRQKTKSLGLFQHRIMGGAAGVSAPDVP